MKERIELSGVYFRVQNPETKKWESVCFEDLELSQQEEVIKDKSKEFLQNLAIKMASTLWQLGNALELKFMVKMKMMKEYKYGSIL